jgi:transposase
MLDNANYHRGVAIQKVMDQLRTPVLYLGPYHFRMAPVEMLFNYVKSRDLNPLRSKTRSR